MPSLGGATGWLNSEPLGPAELRGHVVLVNFWTLTCINWLRTEPYVRAWSQAYRILLPGLPRSTGLAPTWSPHVWRARWPSPRSRATGPGGLARRSGRGCRGGLLEHARRGPLG